MKINLNDIDSEHFSIKEGLVGDEVCYLVTPKQLSVPWNKNNRFFRSSIWNKNGEPVSLSYFKFPNWLEKPDVFPVPDSLNNARAVLKVDGSLLCLSYYNGHNIIRSRGTFDFYQLDNGHEIDVLKAKYPKVFEVPALNPHLSYIYEFVTPTNKIVLDYPEPDIYLIGIVFHEDYTLATQNFCDEVAVKLGVKRPESFTFNSITEMLDTVSAWQGKEGIVLYSGRNDNVLHKIKSLDYLKKHAFKGDATLDNTVELFFQFDCPDFLEFQKQLTEQFDYECFEMVKGHVSLICDAYEESLKIIEGFRNFLADKKHLTRREIADKVLSSYGPTNRASFAFQILDKDNLDAKSKKKLVWQILKK